MISGSAREILYQLPAPIEHESNEVYDTGFKCLSEDRDFTVFVDVTTTARGTVPIFCTMNNATTGNTTIQSSVFTNGGFSVGQWFGASEGAYSYATVKGVKQKLTKYGWAAVGHFAGCVIHKKGSAGIQVVYRFESSLTETVEVDGDAWYLSPDSCLRSIFTGTLHALTVYSWAMTETECASLLA